jgi:predicted RND superfamily exporter protein
MLSSLLVLPSLFVVHERIRNRKTLKMETKMAALGNESPEYKKIENKLIKSKKVKTTDYEFLGIFGQRIANKRILTLSLVVAATAFLAYNATKLQFNYDFLSLEPKGLKSIILQDSVISKFDISTDMVMVTTNSVEYSREVAEKAKKLKQIGMVGSISDFIPLPDEYDQKVEYIETIKSQLTSNIATVPTVDDVDALIDELYRLEDNFIELAQMAYTGGQVRLDTKIKEITGDLEKDAAERKSLIVKLVDAIEENPENAIAALTKFQEQYEPFLRSTLIAMSSTEPVTLETLPNDIKEQYISADGKQFLVSLYPKEQVWNGEFLATFTEQMHKIDEHVTGFPLIVYILIDYIGKDGKLAAGLAILVIFILLLIDFRNFKYALVTLIPLVFGMTWMVGIMNLVGMKLNVLNAMGLPLILGMGVDTGVHIMHRYRIEGAGKIKRVFSTTGKAVLISSLTSVLAFGSLGFAIYRGLASLGITLAIGITTCWLATVIILPAIMSFIDEKEISKQK